MLSSRIKDNKYVVAIRKSKAERKRFQDAVDYVRTCGAGYVYDKYTYSAMLRNHFGYDDDLSPEVVEHLLNNLWIRKAITKVKTTPLMLNEDDDWKFTVYY